MRFIGVGVAVGILLVAVGVGVLGLFGGMYTIRVGVDVGVAEGVCVGGGIVDVAVAVDTILGRGVGVGVEVIFKYDFTVGTGTTLDAVGLTAAVAEGLKVFWGWDVGVSVEVKNGVDVFVGIKVLVGVGVFVGVFAGACKLLEAVAVLTTVAVARAVAVEVTGSFVCVGIIRFLHPSSPGQDRPSSGGHSLLLVRTQP